MGREGLFGMVLAGLLLGLGVLGQIPIHADEAKSTKPAVVVEMTDRLNYKPDEVTIQAGETVEWKNTSRLVHTVTAAKDKANNPKHVHLPEGARPFNSGIIKPGGMYRHTFTVPGMYQYFCIPHEAAGMIGKVIVKPARRE